MKNFLQLFGSRPETTEPVGRPKKPEPVKESKDDTKKMKPEDIIIAKLKKGNRQALSMPEEELREWAQSLCIESELKEWYLNPDFAAVQNAFNKLEEVNAKLVNSKKKSQNMFKSTVESSAQQQEGDEDFNDIDFELDELKKANGEPFMKIGKTVKVKLVIAEICKSDAQKAIRKLLSPVLTKFDHQQQFGMFHSALVVGPWYLEWNNSSLCIPRKCYSSAAMLAADLDFGGYGGLELEPTIDKISKIIIDWNVNKEYNQRNSNCQQFVDELCKGLGIDLSKFEGPLGEYLKNLREKGQCELYFPISQELRENLKIKEKVKKFQTHEELDEFVKGLLEKASDFEEENQADWLLLKSFDRAFWLRHFKHPEDKKYMPHQGKCPFKDPTATTSFKKEWF